MSTSAVGSPHAHRRLEMIRVLGPVDAIVDGRTVTCGSRLERTTVSVGLQTVGAVEITEGLYAEDQVVLGPLHGLTDGARVEARLRDAGQRH